MSEEAVRRYFAGTDDTLRVLADVLDERIHQAAIGWTPEHDDQHRSGTLMYEAIQRVTHMGEFPTDDRVRHELVVGAALFIAEIERHDRALRARTIALESGPDYWYEEG